MWEYREGSRETACSRGKRTQKDKIVITPSFSQQCLFPESLLSHAIASYCFEAVISQVAGVSRHGKRGDVLAQEVGRASFLPKCKQCWNKVMAEMKGEHARLTVGQHFQQML